MRVLVCGGRGYADRATLFHTLDRLHREMGFTVVIHGAAPGADSLADAWARKNKIPREPYPAEWDTHGHSAGPIRNTQMLVNGMPERVVAFPGGAGTADMVSKAKAAGLWVWEVQK